MASGYVTSDGKDLDSRYLGISAKAASAKTADNATHATSADTATKATTATNVTNKGSVKLSQAPIYVSTNASYTAPTFGILIPAKSSSGYFVESEIGYLSARTSVKYAIGWVCNKGDQISFGGADALLFPIAVS